MTNVHPQGACVTVGLLTTYTEDLRFQGCTNPQGTPLGTFPLGSTVTSQSAAISSCQSRCTSSTCKFFLVLAEGGTTNPFICYTYALTPSATNCKASQRFPGQTYAAGYYRDAVCPAILPNISV